MLDIGADFLFTAVYHQAQAYIRHFNTKIHISNNNDIQAQFGIGTTTSISFLTVDSPIGSIRFYVVKADIPFLLYLLELNRLEISFENLRNHHKK